MAMNLINMWELSNHQLFTGIVLPEEIDKNLVINNILELGGEYDVITADVDFFKFLISNFFETNFSTFSRIAKALSAEYNPIENYDRFEDSTRNFDTKGTDTRTNQISAYNSETFNNDTQVSGDSVRADTDVFTTHIHGNIGVTTAPTMQKEYIELYKKYNIYEVIARMFFAKYCIKCI